MKNKNLKIVVGILVIIIAIGVGYFLGHKGLKRETPILGGALMPQTKIYEGQGFSFMYDTDAQATPSKSSDISVVDIKKNNTINTFVFYPGALPSNFRPQFFTDTMVVNGKTISFGDVQAEGGMTRSYMYKKNGKTVVIGPVYIEQDPSLIIDLGSIEIK